MVVLGGQGDDKFLLQVPAEVAHCVERDIGHIVNFLLLIEALQIVIVVLNGLAGAALADFQIFEKVSMEGFKIRHSFWESTPEFLPFYSSCFMVTRILHLF